MNAITNAAGQPVEAANPNCHQAVASDVAAAAVDATRCPIGEQSAFGACDGGTATAVAGILGNRPAGGKTGSSEQNATETFVGFTPQIAAAGIAANPDNPRDYVGSAVSPLVNPTIPSGSGSRTDPHPPHATGKCATDSSATGTCINALPAAPGCLPALRPPRPRIDVGGGLASPSEEGGLDEFFEFNPNWRHNSTFSTRNAAFSTTSRALSTSRPPTCAANSSRRAVNPTTTTASSS